MSFYKFFFFTYLVISVPSVGLEPRTPRSEVPHPSDRANPVPQRNNVQWNLKHLESPP